MRTTEPGEQGRYGRLNDILTEDDKIERRKKMQAYALEDKVAAHMFARNKEVVFSWDRAVLSAMK